jgi:hypothetical protein
LSNALGISAVTAALESMLWNVYNGPEWSKTALGGVAVTAVAPDLVQSHLGNGTDTSLQVNLFLHQVTFNAAWRNMGLPSLDAGGATRLKNPPLALDLHYLLTVYASEDCEAEALLGYALQFIHESPVLQRAQIRSALANLATPGPNPVPNANLNVPPNPAFPLSTNPLFGLVGLSGIADQIEMLKITPATLGRDEMAWLWTALKADYRPTFPFQVSVLLIQPQIPAVAALPVLRRDITVQSGLIGTLTQISPPNSQPAASLGDTVTVTGTSLGSAQSVTLSNNRFGVALPLSPLPNGTDNSFQFSLTNPASANNLPAGVYLVTAQLKAGTANVSTNSLPFAIAPQITNVPLPALKAGSQVPVAVQCSPDLFVGQQVSLLVGSQEALLAAPISTQSSALQFVFQTLQSTGGASVPVRLRVDGIDSPIMNMTQTPPVFSGPSVQVNP